MTIAGIILSEFGMRFKKTSMRYFLKAVKNAGIFIILLHAVCVSLHAEDYNLSFVQTDDGFKFFVMQSSETGHVGGCFRNYVPEPEMSVTLGLDLFGKSPVHHLVSTEGLAVFAINNLFFNIESDRTVTLWGGEADDRVFIYNKNNLNLKLACEHFNGTVFYRLKSEKWKPIIIKPFNK